jgi:hypothetical protein
MVVNVKGPQIPVSQSVLGVPDGRIPESVNNFVTVIIAATGVAQPVLAAFRPGHQGVVRVRAHNGQAAGNVAPVQVADYREGAAIGAAGAQTLTPNTEMIFPTDNTGRLWISGTLGDGVQISVKGTI